MTSIFTGRFVLFIVASGLLLVAASARADAPTKEEIDALNQEFGIAYKLMLERKIPGDWPELADALRWKQGFSEGYFYDNRGQTVVLDRQVLENAYRDHIQMLLNLPKNLGVDTPVKGITLNLNDSSQQYDLTLRLFAPCLFMYDERLLRADANICRELGQLMVYKKGQPEVLQVFTRQFYVEFDKDQKPRDITSFQYVDGNHVMDTLRDVNFDGYEDLVIYNDVADRWNGRGIIFAVGDASVPSRLVYLFDPKQERFVYAEEMSVLLSTYHHLYANDKKRFILERVGESCGSAHFSETTEWQIVNNRPVPVTRRTSNLDLCEDGQDNGRDYCYVDVKENFVHDEWREGGKDYTPCVLVDSEGPVDSCEIK